MSNVYLLKKAFKHAINDKKLFFSILIFFTVVISLITLERSFHYDAEFDIWVFSSRAWFIYNFIPFWAMTTFIPLVFISIQIVFETLFCFKELTVSQNYDNKFKS